jgi:D-alanyl-lipoteichoic acid acyltransferase DltB (MBOAT superfamily)
MPAAQMVNFFVSRAFLTRVPIALTIYYLLPTARLQVLFLVGTSPVIFCLAAGSQLRLICFAALVTAVTSLGAVQAQPPRRRLGLCIEMGLNLALLIFFKYKRLLSPESLYQGLFGTSPTMSAIYNFALPVGILFNVFHGISLIVDSYRDRTVIDASAEPPNAITHLRPDPTQAARRRPLAHNHRSPSCGDRLLTLDRSADFMGGAGFREGLSHNPRLTSI